MKRFLSTVTKCDSIISSYRKEKKRRPARISQTKPKNIKTGRFYTWRFPITAFHFLQKQQPLLKEKPLPGMGKKIHAVGCTRLQGRAERATGKGGEDYPERMGLGRPPTGKSPSELPAPAPRRKEAARCAEEAPRLRTQPNVTSLAPPGREAPDVTRRGLPEGRRCWPAVTRHARSQSALGAGAGRPLNSARQLPAVWRVHSAMQYVCQRCGTKEQPFCDWAGPAPRCQGLRELLPVLTTELPFISAPENQKRGGGGGFGISGFNSLYFDSSQKSRFLRIISVIKWLPLKKLPVPVHKQLHYAICNHPQAFRITAKRLI